MDVLQDEVESLEAILMDDVHIKRNSQSVPEVIETTVYPVVEEETEQQYVCVTLQVLPTPGYPDTSPDFKLLRPRGLDDARLESIRKSCVTKLQESVGFPVVFDLIEVVREKLTGSNLPSGQCVVCLYGFSDGDEFTRTQCFHYLHSYCLGRHLNALRRNYQEEYDKLPSWLQKTTEPFQASCPVCREPINDENDSLKCAMPPAELQNAPDFKLTRELRELQQRMSCLFLQQKSRGGIIDLDAESSAVLSIETEAEIRRRLQRKQDETVAENSASNLIVCSSASEGRRNSNVSERATVEQKDVTSCKPSGSSHFAPSVQNTQRAFTDPENNNNRHQHNRRSYRGGRRHQHHQHREREREHEKKHSSHSGGNEPTAEASGKHASSNDRHTKTQAAGNAQLR